MGRLLRRRRQAGPFKAWRDHLDRILSALPPAAVAALALATVVALGRIDEATGAELSSSVFYSAPTAITAWYAGFGWSAVVSLASAGTWYWADASAGATYSAPWIPVWNAAVRLLFFLIIARLLTLLRAALESQRALAESDALTGLANSRSFLRAVEAEVERSMRYGRPLSLAYIDLDGFKAVNDRFGHAAGDDVLQAVGAQLRECTRRADLPARLGGDEFALLLPETDEQAAQDAAEKIRHSLTDAMDLRGWPVGFSMGVVTATGALPSAEELIRQADALMYEVKGSGKGRTTFQQAVVRVADPNPVA